MIKQDEIVPVDTIKRFDCVKMMRDIRNDLDEKFATMTWAEQQMTIAKLAASTMLQEGLAVERKQE
jgi:hypothetical protein